MALIEIDIPNRGRRWTNQEVQDWLNTLGVCGAFGRSWVPGKPWGPEAQPYMAVLGQHGALGPDWRPAEAVQYPVARDLDGQIELNRLRFEKAQLEAEIRRIERRKKLAAAFDVALEAEWIERKECDEAAVEPPAPKSVETPEESKPPDNRIPHLERYIGATVESWLQNQMQQFAAAESAKFVEQHVPWRAFSEMEYIPTALSFGERVTEMSARNIGRSRPPCRRATRSRRRSR